MTIFVDADACPVKEIILQEAGDEEIWMVHNRHHRVHYDRANVNVKETGDRSDAADHWIANNLDPGDVVVTDDLGLAALVLGRGAKVLRFRGQPVAEEMIELKLAMRSAAARERKKHSHKGGGPPAFTREDEETFRRNFRNLLDNL